MGEKEKDNNNDIMPKKMIPPPTTPTATTPTATAATTATPTKSTNITFSLATLQTTLPVLRILVEMLNSYLKLPPTDCDLNRILEGDKDEAAKLLDFFYLLDLNMRMSTTIAQELSVKVDQLDRHLSTIIEFINTLS